MKIADASALEGDSITFTVTLEDRGVTGGFTVTPSFHDGTAARGTDYTQNTAGIKFTGTVDETHTFTVTTTEDDIAEVAETFTVALAVSGTSARVVYSDTATGTINDDDTANVTIADASADEGAEITFTVTTDRAVQGGFTVTPSFTHGTAKGTDYTENTAGIDFSVTDKTKTFTVATTEDQVVEGDETFTVNLAVSGTSLTVTASDTATGTIENDDTATVTIADKSATEGDAITFTVTAGSAVQGSFTVTPSFTDGTATKGIDYTQNTEALTFAGTAGEAKTFTVATTEDQVVEDDETFTVNLAVSVTSETVTATGTILNDEAVLTIDDESANEGDQIRFTVTLEGAVDKGLTVTPSFTDGTATKGTDYTQDTAGITFAGTVGETQTVTVATREDQVVEGGETFTVKLAASGTSVAVTATDTATGTIRDDDDAPEVNLSVGPSSVSEGASDSTVTVTAAFSTGNTFPEDQTVTVSVGAGTATAGTDYAAVTSFDITIPEGKTIGTGTFTLRPIQDTAVEGNETIDVAGSAGDLTVNGAELRLTDDDGPPEVNLSVSPSSVREGASDTTVTVTAEFSTDRTFPEDETVTVSVGGGSATSGTDYAAVSDFDITIPKGATSGTRTFTLRPTQDTAVEGNETIDVAGSAGDLTVNGAELRLTDDDGAPEVNLSVSPSSVNEGASDTTVTVTAEFSTGSTFPDDETVTVSVGGGTATSGTDYAAVSNFDITIPKGATSGTGTFTLRPTQDTAVEGNETIDVAGRASDLTVKGTELTLTDDDGAPEVNLSVSPSSVSEEDESTTVTVTAAFSSGSTFGQDTPVRVSVGGGTATAGTDYAAVPGFDVTIQEGETSGTATFTLTPTADAAVEAAETIRVTGSASGLTVNGTRLTLADSTTSLGVRGARAGEGETMEFTVTLRSASSRAVTVQYATADGTATAGADYTSTSGRLVFSAGETERRVSVPVADDDEVEDNETFTLAVQLANAAGSPVSATGTIVENDVLTVSFVAPDVRETDGLATFTGTLSSASSYPIVVEYATSDGTATAGADYLKTTGELVFAPGETEKAVAVPVLDDDLVEGAETMLLSMTVVPRALGSSVGRTPPILLAGSGATGNGEPASLQITGMIRDDDLARTRSAGTSRTLYLLARSMASEAVAAIGDRFVTTGGDDDTARAALDAGPQSSGHGGALAGAAAAYPAAVSSTGGGGATPWPDQGATALHRAPDEPFADLGWLRDASFSVPVGDASQSGRWQVWGRAGTVRSRLQTRTGGHARGDVFASHVGVDRRLGGSALLGVSLSHTVGLLGYSIPDPLVEGALPGEADGRVTSVQPYAHWAPRDGLTVWGMGGGGLGSLTLADSAGMVETPLGLRLFAGGARQALTAGLALKADVFHATLRSAEHADLAAATGTAMRGRMLAEGQTDWALSESTTLIPRLEAGVRWDGGTDVEGMGAEVGVGLAYVNRRLNLGLETQGRYLVAHQADGFEEWGAGLTLRVGPGVDRPGPWLALHPEWGAAGSRVQALWDPRAAPELHRGGGAPGARPDRIGATAGYRLSEANSVSVGVLQETRPGAGRAVAARLTGNLNWGGGTGGELRAPADSGFRRGESAAAGDAPPAVRQVPVRLDAVAVGPFLNLSGAPVDHWIGDGVTETLTRAFEQLDAISLVGGGEAGAAAPAWLVTGEYQRRGNWLQFDARVVDTRSGAVAARSRAEGVAAELFELQDRIAASLARELRNLSAGDRAGDRAPAARELPRQRPDERRAEGGEAAAGPRQALARRPAGNRDTGNVEARASAPLRLGTVEARRSMPARLDTVAIERFHNLSGAPEDDWLGAGVTETLTTAFQQLDAVKVARHTGGADPEAAWLVTGDYRRQGDRLQIDARVVDTRSGAVAARSGVEGAAADFFDLQDRITADLAGALENLSAGREAGYRGLEAPERPRLRLAGAGSQDARIPADASRNVRDRVESVSQRPRLLGQTDERLLASVFSRGGRR
ncbi:MAG: hypothetical protein OXH75_13770 [Acidobacteria bacterium]|nr:hypothetical protein [Acidobacteriota bacterium]